MRKHIKKHSITLIFIAILMIMTVVDASMSANALTISWQNLVTMMGVIPPIFVLIGLMDVFVPKTTMIKYMGQESGGKGLFFAFLLGSMAAGPLYAAFPVAGLLIKKGARLAYVIFFLGTWTSAKIPLLLFEITALGLPFTIIHVSSMLTFYLIGAFLTEKLLSPQEKQTIIARIEAL